MAIKADFRTTASGTYLKPAFSWSSLVQLAVLLGTLSYQVAWDALIVTLSLLFGLITIYLIYQKQFIGAGLSYMVSFFFDIMDGDYARRYNMTSKFGDYYDHIKDIVVGFGVLFALYQNNKFSKNVTIVIVILTLTLLSLMLIQVGCQEKYKSQIKSSNNHDSLRFLIKLCVMDPEKWLENNIFGSGFFNLYLSLLIISYSFTKK